jgi:hypothetical protein
MTQWHADIDGPALVPGAKLTVLSDHHVVRVVTGDTLSIETPSGPRLSAMVLDRTAADIRLALNDGSCVPLEMQRDESLRPPSEHAVPFSRQLWVVH